MSAPRVTVLMAVYNGAEYLREAIDSVIGQTFSDLELLIVDDASTDETVAIVESYDDPRIRLLRNETNLNQVVSLNRGLVEARGDYVARLDHDDVCRPTRLERQVAVLDTRPDVGVVGCFMEMRDEVGAAPEPLANRVADYPDFLYAILTERRLLGHPAVMFRREAVLSVRGYEEAARWAEDRELWARLALARWHAVVIEEALVVYRWHTEQQTQTSRSLQLAAAAKVQEHFVGALAGPEHGHALALLFARDPARFWNEGLGLGAPRALDALLAGAGEQLALSDAEATRFAQLVAAHVERVARRAWKTSPAAQRDQAGELWAWASGRLGGRRQWPYRATVAAAPALYRARRLRISATDSFHHSPRTARLKSLGRRSQRLARLYRRVVSDR
jgi:GT2 family glycosyltransferase